MEYIIKELSLKQFRNFGITTFSLNDKNIIIGRNGSGKTTILNAITWLLVNCDMYGKSMNILQDGANLAYVEANCMINSYDEKIKRINELKNHSINSLKSMNLQKENKDIFLSICNPRYFINLSANKIREILPYIININKKDIDNKINIEILDTVFNFIPNKLTVNTQLDTINVKTKELKEQLQNEEKDQIKIQAIIDIIRQTLNAYELNKNDKNDLLNKLKGYSTELDEITLNIESYKDAIKSIGIYKKSITNVLANEFNKSLTDTSIVIEKDGKDIFEIYYKNRNIKTVSFTEGLLAGIEISNTISKLTNISLPLLIDNAESILDIDFSRYHYIKQIIATIVTDDDLSIYNKGTLINIETKKAMRRSKKSLTPTITILKGWGKQ